MRRLSDDHAALVEWEACLADLSGLQHHIAALPPFPLHAVLPDGPIPVDHETPALWRAMLLLSYLAHAYVWGDPSRETPTTLPSKLAQPWVVVAAALDVPPVLNYATYVLLNWQRIDPTEPIALGNLTSLANFTGGTKTCLWRLPCTSDLS